MGYSASTFRMMAKWNEGGYLLPKTSIFELGAQEINHGNENDERIIHQFIMQFNSNWKYSKGVKYCGQFASKVFKEAGFEYKAVDIYETEDTLAIDLNHENLSSELKGKFDIAINTGTTEHIFNQAQVFKVIHDAVKPGGYIYHSLPSMGMLNHGLFKYEPIFFIFLASANNYEVKFLKLSPLSEFFSVPDYLSNDLLLNNLYFGSSNISCLLKKTDESELKFPVDYDITRVDSGLHKGFFRKYPMYRKLVDDRYHIFRRDISAEKFPEYLSKKIENLDRVNESTENNYDRCPIRVVEATYGLNMIKEKENIQGSIPLCNGNVTKPIQKLIFDNYDDKDGCVITIDVNYLNDPAPHKVKDFILHYQKGIDDTVVQSIYVSAEAHGKKIKIPSLHNC